MNSLVKKCCEATSRTPEDLAKILAAKENWGALVHSFEYLTILGIVRDEIGKLGEEQDELARIRELHQKSTGVGGMTSGFCCECDHLWPCPTYHVAAGWGASSYYECLENNWCSHVEDVLG